MLALVDVRDVRVGLSDACPEAFAPWMVLALFFGVLKKTFGSNVEGSQES